MRTDVVIQCAPRHINKMFICVLTPVISVYESANCFRFCGMVLNAVNVHCTFNKKLRFLEKRGTTVCVNTLKKLALGIALPLSCGA